MHRILAGLIAVVLAAAVGVAINRSNDETKPLVQTPTDSPTPKQTFTFNGPPPTVPLETETPIVPPTEPAASPTETVDRLPNTGSGTTWRVAVLMLILGLGAGVLVRRAAQVTR